MISVIDIHIARWPVLPWKRRASLSDKAVGGIALTVSTIASSTFNAYAKVLTGALSALSILFVSEMLTALFVFFTFGAVHIWRHMRRLHRRDFLWLIIAGFFNGVGGPLLLFIGLFYTSAINAGFFGNMEMVFMVILAAVMLRERLYAGHYAATIAILFGTIVISLRGFTEGLTLHIGDLIVIASSFGFAIGSAFYRKHLSHVEPHLALFARSMIAIVLFFILSPFIRHPFITQVMHFPTALIPALLGFGFISRFLSSVTFYKSMEKLTLTTVSLVNSLTVVGSTLFAFWYLGEPIEWYHYVGGAFIVGGTIILEFVGIHPNTDQAELHLKQRMK